MKPEKIIKLVINLLITLFIMISIGIFSYYVFKLSVIPYKYLIPGYTFLILVILFSLFLIFKSKKLVIRIVFSILLILLSCGLVYSTGYFRNTYNFLGHTQVKYDTLTYSVIVLKDSDYNKISNLKNKNIAYLDDDYSSNIKTNLHDKIKYTETKATDFSKLYEMLKNKEVDAIVLESSYIVLAEEEIEDYSENTKVIYNFDLMVKAHKEDSEVDITKPFILYISGIDKWGSVNSVRGRSDVNQILVINPKTHHILIVNTPRDYYVQLAGTTGLRDKLTHAGIYGINKSVATLENLYNIDINHYVRVNFNTLVKVVDVIGGVDIYSDITFNSFHIKGWTVPEGWNHFNGKQALAYSRERYAYRDGDHHRGRNQQQVIEAIIDKVTKSSTLISKYNSILNSLDGTFQTDISTGTITSFIRYQLDKMPTWTVDSVQAYGYNSYNYTYSMGYKYYLWVMEPDWSSINSIKKKINEVLNEE